MGVADFDTKMAVIVRDDLAPWQRLNVTAFLTSGVVAHAGAAVVGEDYEDADGERYLPLLVQPVLVYEAGADKLRTVLARVRERELPAALYTADMFATGNDDRRGRPCSSIRGNRTAKESCEARRENLARGRYRP